MNQLFFTAPQGYRQLIVTVKLNEGFMIWGHDPPRTHEKITGKTDSFLEKRKSNI